MLFNVLFTKAQDHGFFNQVWLEQGLSQSSISSILQDNKGFIWLGTQDGLNRYDGRIIDHYNFKPFDSKTISGDDIYSFCSDNTNLWTLSAGGLDKMDFNSSTVTHLKEEIKTGEKPSTLYRIWYVNNSLLLYTAKGLSKIKISNTNNFTLIPFVFEEKQKSELHTIAHSVCGDERNNLYAATNKGVFVLHPTENSFQLLPGFENIIKTETNTPVECNTVLNKNNRLYFSVSNSFYVYNVQTTALKSLSLGKTQTAVITNALIDNQNNIWLGTNSGLYRLGITAKDSIYIDKSFYKNPNNRFGLQSNDITALYQNPNSKDDIVWIGTRDAGAFNYSYSKNSFTMASAMLSNNDLNFFATVKDKDGIIWAGLNYGLCKLDRQNKTFTVLNLNSQLLKLNRFIEALYCDDENNIWTAYGNGLYKVDKKTNTLKTILEPLSPNKRNHVVRIVKYTKDELILCTWQGLVIYNTVTGKANTISEIEINGEKQKIESPSCFYIDTKNNWWLGTSKGLFCINVITSQNKFYTNNVSDTNSLVSKRVMDVNETTKGEIIVATTKGLSILKNPDGKTSFKNYYFVKGLSNSFIYGLLRDDKGLFWMTTNFGISVFNPETQEFKSYSASDGVCINEFNSAGFHKAYDGELLFGGIGGLVSIYPNKQIINKNTPDVFLKSVRIENFKDTMSMASNTPLNLSYNQNKLFFEFSVPDFSGADNINLFYHVQQNSTSWTKVNPSQIFSLVFANLAPGTYNLEVKAVNSEGIESKPFSFSFIISPPFWNTGWFFVLIIVGVILATWAVYRIRLQNKIAHIKELEDIRKEENEKVRKAAALDLHDEFGNGLTRISKLVEMARIHVPPENKEAIGILDVISQNTTRLYHGTKDFIWSINPGNDNLYEIIIRIKDFGDELFYGTGCEFEVIGLQEEFKNIKQHPSSGRNIAMIFKEALSNTIKHSKADKVKLSIEPNGIAIAVKLKDNGAGFEMKNDKNSFGLSNMQQRAAKAGAVLQIHSEKEEGTEIILKINKN
ncbi:MAG TPA: two-component regulator propeller domain-containing protein [Bacteroidia bacterium]|nr:two-component regulator propeller domain-containing protein [Bacteroidia bacterium]